MLNDRVSAAQPALLLLALKLELIVGLTPWDALRDVLRNRLRLPPSTACRLADAARAPERVAVELAGGKLLVHDVDAPARDRGGRAEWRGGDAGRGVRAADRRARGDGVEGGAVRRRRHRRGDGRGAGGGRAVGAANELNGVRARDHGRARRLAAVDLVVAIVADASVDHGRSRRVVQVDGDVPRGVEEG